jgi:hypothetical protein
MQGDGGGHHCAADVAGHVGDLRGGPTWSWVTETVVVEEEGSLDGLTPTAMTISAGRKLGEDHEDPTAGSSANPPGEEHEPGQDDQFGADLVGQRGHCRGHDDDQRGHRQGGQPGPQAAHAEGGGIFGNAAGADHAAGRHTGRRRGGVHRVPPSSSGPFGAVHRFVEAVPVRPDRTRGPGLPWHPGESRVRLRAVVGHGVDTATRGQRPGVTPFWVTLCQLRPMLS